MTPLRPEQLEVRLRLAAERATGPRVVIDKEDLLRLLDTPRQPPPVDLDALNGCGFSPANIPENIPAQAAAPGPAGQRPTAPVQPPAGRGRRNVVLAATNVDAARLAQAAWDSNFGRVAEHGGYDRLEPGPQWAMVQDARRAIEFLVAE